MSYLSDAHTQWHQANGKYATCDLDCGASEAVGNFFEDDYQDLQVEGAHRIRCAHCKGVHASIAAVKFCREVKWDLDTARRNEEAMAEEMAAAGDCEHGLNLTLCSGPLHW